MGVVIEKLEIHLNGQVFEAVENGDVEKLQAEIKRLKQTIEEFKKRPVVEHTNELYGTVKEAIEKLHAGLEEGPKKDTVGYVMTLFAIAEQQGNPAKRGPKNEPTKNHSERMKQAWVTRKQRKAEQSENEKL